VPELAVIPSAASELPHRFLSPGELLVLGEPCEVTTILGPCIAVTFWCRQTHLAAICHAMLPKAGANGSAPTQSTSWKYVNEVIPEMFTRFERQGGKLASLETKLFGGAELLHGIVAEPGGRIGPQNIQLARQLLAQHQVAVVASDVGGKSGRKLIFNTRTGDVRIKLLFNTIPPFV